MKTSNPRFKTVDDYMATLSPSSRALLERLRASIRKVVPEAEEVISYNMPAFRQEGILIWYAAYKKHIGLYPKTSVMHVFGEELEGYETSKGTIQFPLDKPLPILLIKKIVKYRLKENQEQAQLKRKK